MVFDDLPEHTRTDKQTTTISSTLMGHITLKRSALAVTDTCQTNSMQALAPSPGVDSTFPLGVLGIHDLLEQSISRSRLGAGVTSNHTATASPRVSTTTKPHSSSGTLRSQSGSRRSHERPEVQAAPQAATSITSTASLEENENDDLSRTAMPQRRQLEYPSPGSNTDHTLNLSRADKKAANQVCLCTEILVHLLQAADSTTCSDSQASANKKTARAARVPSPLNRLHSTPVAALLLGSDRNEQPHSRPTSTPGLVVLRYSISLCTVTSWQRVWPVIGGCQDRELLEGHVHVKGPAAGRTRRKGSSSMDHLGNSHHLYVHQPAQVGEFSCCGCRIA